MQLTLQNPLNLLPQSISFRLSNRKKKKKKRFISLMEKRILHKKKK
jgi:hypothetical protein